MSDKHDDPPPTVPMGTRFQGREGHGQQVHGQQDEVPPASVRRAVPPGAPTRAARPHRLLTAVPPARASEWPTARAVGVEVEGDAAFLVVTTRAQRFRFALAPAALDSLEQDLAAARAGFDVRQLCTCGDTFRDHGPLAPHPCRARCAMTAEELSEEADSPLLTRDPRYGCRCTVFTPAPPLVAGGG